jgi:hypothetical protein
MDTFRLFFENDKEIPRFKRLAYEKVNVSIKDVILNGIHPWMGGNVHKTLGEKFVQVLNSDDLKPKELTQPNYCQDVTYSCCYSYCNDTTPFEETLNHIKEGIYFVDGLTYIELLSIAKERLKKLWSHKIAYDLLERAHPGFDAMRSFLRSRDKRIKLSGYADINTYNLRHILSLSDFEGEDNLIISHGIPVTNFRSTEFLKRITDENGLLRLTNRIEYFRIQVDYEIKDKYSRITLNYNCQSNCQKVRFCPEINNESSKRDKLKEFSSQWRTDDGRYCFTTDISKISQMLEQRNCQISFPTLDYIHPKEGYISYANISVSKVKLYSIEGYMTHCASCDTIKDVLRKYDVSMTGIKEDLVEKFANLCVNVYEEKEPEIDDYFTNNRFVRIPKAYDSDKNTFPILKGCDLREMVLTMYIIKHMRGNTILEARHNNDTYDLLSLTLALLKKEVYLDGVFLRVE